MKDIKGVQVQSVSRALQILNCFEQEEELGISELAREMMLGKSTTYALVNTLAANGFLEQSVQTKKYRLGIRNFELGRLFQQRVDWWLDARPLIRELIGPYHETIHVAMHERGQVIYFNSIKAQDVNVLYTQSGQRAPMHCSSVGKAMLAFLPDKYLKDYVLSKPLKSLTPNSITDVDMLLSDLQKTRQRGYAYDNEEIEMGLRCVGVPVFDMTGYPFAAISVCGPVHRMTSERMEDIAKSLKKCALLVSKRMGYHG